MTQHKGQLELTWSNKDLRLLAPDDGSYEWVPPGDHRVAEVRLLNDVVMVGEDSNALRAKDNLLIRGDALNALTSLEMLPEFAQHIVGKVKLVYIDPPFNTKQAFPQYDDALEHSVWLTMIRDRLAQVEKLLAPDGSVWVHLDDSEMAYCRVVLDEVFGRKAFVGTVVWENFYGRSNSAAISNSHNYILVYSPLGQDWRRVRNLLPRDEKSRKKYSNPDEDPRGDWRPGPIFAPEERHEGLMYTIKTPSGRPVSPPKGSHWRMTEPELWKLIEDGRILFGDEGDNQPAVKLFLNEVQDGLVPRSWWGHKEVGHSQEGKREIQDLFPDVTPFATPKPERLLQRIVEISTSRGELVLDCYLGSGTTAAVAHKMQRRWVGIERDAGVLETFAYPRLEKVVANLDPGGVTESEEWGGGGSFRVFDVAPSMFEAEEGVVYLAEWAVNGKLHEATAAQLGYTFEFDPPFCGRKGNTRLAVIDGVITEELMMLLVAGLEEKEKLVICGTSVPPKSREFLRSLRPGSNVRKIPASLLEEYRLGQVHSLAGASVETTSSQEGGTTLKVVG